MTNRTKATYAIITAIFICILLYLFLPKNDKTFINTLGIIGCILSLVGLVLAYIQILSIKQIAEDTKMKITENITLNNNILMLSDLARKAEIVGEIQGYLRDDKIEMCILRMRDLKVILNTIKNQERYRSLVAKKEFRTIFENFNLDLTNFQTHKFTAKGKIDKAIISTHLEDLSTLFLSVEVQLKNQNHDS
ncbi:hypothetical protein [Mucilaginibacter lappiensis]|uniref:hypothetical protein n=1 Tax=Mucilaginibacter lappiensis TaxID=354630 RepID=UPI003D1A537F